jgi:hypothetical protein
MEKEKYCNVFFLFVTAAAASLCSSIVVRKPFVGRAFSSVSLSLSLCTISNHSSCQWTFRMMMYTILLICSSQYFYESSETCRWAHIDWRHRFNKGQTRSSWIRSLRSRSGEKKKSKTLIYLELLYTHRFDLRFAQSTKRSRTRIEER